MFITILIFIGILGVLILVHEFGHFIAARAARARVEEFGIGFPPRIFGKKRGETIYSINLFPIGGFVKIYGEDGAKRGDPRSFASKTIMVRALIITAGVLMNIALAAVLFSAGHFIGLPKVIDEGAVDRNVKNVAVRIVEIAEDSPAANSGIGIGDTIVALSSDSQTLSDVKKIEDVQGFIDNNLGKTIVVSLKRGGDVSKIEVIPRENPPEGEGAIGIAMVRTGDISYPIYLAPIKGIETTFFVTVGTLRAFGDIISSFVSTGELEAELTGPVGIAVITGQVQKMGFIFLLQFMALISINLAIINVLPFPALDGGRLLFLGIEKIKGSPVNQKYERIAHTVGFAILIFLMIAITLRDVGRFL